MDQFITDSRFFLTLNKPDENEVLELLNNMGVNYNIIEKMYGGELKFTDKELLKLVNDLDALDNKNLEDFLLFAKYKNHDFFSNNLNANLLKIYDEFVLRNNIFLSFFGERKYFNLQMDLQCW